MRMVVPTMLGLAAKTRRQMRIAEDDFVIAAGLGFFRQEVAAELGLDAEHAEEIWCDCCTDDALRTALDAEVEGTSAHCGQIGEAVIELLEVTELGRGDPVLVVGRADSSEARPDFNEAIRLAVREGAQKDRVEHTEDGGVGADAEGHGEENDGREARPLCHLPDCEAQILQKNAHLLTSGCLGRLAYLAD